MKIWLGIEKGGRERCEKLIQPAWNKDDYKEDPSKYMKYPKIDIYLCIIIFVGMNHIGLSRNV